MPITFATPTSRDTLVASLAELDAQAGALWRSFTPEEFFTRPPGGGWSPAQNVAHLRTGTVPIIWTLKMPKWLLRALFGRAKRASRGYEEIRERYHQVLAAGGGAGAFTPRKKPLPRDPAQAQAKALEAWQRLIPRLAAAIVTWPEAELDRYNAPHPLLGKLTVTEMLYFTLYHLSHHAKVVAGRREQST
ncbi:MAG: DinB family protein [Pirellulales bacterium]|nr:DinB family protein [Pirellulales bacterium]